MPCEAHHKRRAGHGEQRPAVLWTHASGAEHTMKKSEIERVWRYPRQPVQCSASCLCPVQVGAVTGSPSPSPPTPAPTTPAPSPTPPPSPGARCPSDSVDPAASDGCMWNNGTHGVVMPPPEAISEYCEYISAGYFGYTFPRDADATEPYKYPCPPSAERRSDLVPTENGVSAYWFCVWTNGVHGITIPAAAVAQCSALTAGKIGWLTR